MAILKGVPNILHEADRCTREQIVCTKKSTMYLSKLQVLKNKGCIMAIFQGFPKFLHEPDCCTRAQIAEKVCTLSSVDSNPCILLISLLTLTPVCISLTEIGENVIFCTVCYVLFDHASGLLATSFESLKVCVWPPISLQSRTHMHSLRRQHCSTNERQLNQKQLD